MNVLRSNGESAVRAHVVAVVRPTRGQPVIEADRVQIREMRPASAAPAPRASTGPRNPERRTLAAPTTPGIELPDARPATQAQRIIIDPDLVARWRAEAANAGTKETT